MSLPGPRQPRTAADPRINVQVLGAGSASRRRALACSSVGVYAGESADPEQPPALRRRSSRDVPAAQHAWPRMPGLPAEGGRSERTRDARSQLRPAATSSV